MSEASKPARMGKIYFSRMLTEDLEEHAQQGYMRAQYYLGKAYVEGNFPFNHVEESERLDQAEKWLRLAFDNNGINPDETKVMAGYKDVKEDAQRLLSEVLWRQAQRESWEFDDSFPEPFTAKGKAALWKGLDIKDVFIENKVAELYLYRHIENIGEQAQSEAENRKQALSLLVKNAHKRESNSKMHLRDYAHEIGALDIRAAYGEALVLSGYRSDNTFYGQMDVKEGFKILEQLGDFKANGYEGYKAARDTLKSLEICIAADQETLQKSTKSKVQKAGLSEGFDTKAEGEARPSNPFLDRIKQIRATIERSKQDSDFEPDDLDEKRPR